MELCGTEYRAVCSRSLCGGYLFDWLLLFHRRGVHLGINLARILTARDPNVTLLAKRGTPAAWVEEGEKRRGEARQPAAAAGSSSSARKINLFLIVQ